MLLSDPPLILPVQQTMHVNSTTLLRELRALRGAARDLDDARSDYECMHAVDASFSAEDLLEHFIAALGDQLESCGLALPMVRA